MRAANLTPSTFINQQEVGVFFNGKRYRFGFTEIEFCPKCLDYRPRYHGLPFKP